MFFKIGVFKNFANATEKDVLKSFLRKLQAKTSNFINEGSNTGAFL